jgi:hypothetical protein
MIADNKIAVRVAQYFFNATHKRPTAATMKQSIGQARSLLNANFTPEEIIMVINYLVEHPPKDGLKSLGFLSYVMEDVLTQCRAKEVMKSFNNIKQNPTPDVFLDESKKITHMIRPVEKRLGSEYETNLF